MAQREFDVAARSMADQRRMMVDGQVRTYDVTDQRVLEVFYRTPRETTLPASLAQLAYSDAPLTLPVSSPGQRGRTLLQPMVLAKLLQGATLHEGDRVLIVAGASGYCAALVAPLVQSVVTLDSDPGLSAQATEVLVPLALPVTIATGPLAQGYASAAPYDRIIVNGGVETGLAPLFGQLSPGGCLVTIELLGNGATRRAGKAVRFDRIGDGISSRALFDATTPVLDAFSTPDTFVF